MTHEPTPTGPAIAAIVNSWPAEMPEGDRRAALTEAAYLLSAYSADAPGTPCRDALVILNAAINSHARALLAASGLEAAQDGERGVTGASVPDRATHEPSPEGLGPAGEYPSRWRNMAKNLWASQHRFSMFEDALGDLIGEYTRLGHDDYDQSLEIHGAPEDMRLSEAAQLLIHAAGFGKVYVNHVELDGQKRWETHYRLDGPLPARGWRRQARNGGFNISYWPESWNGPGCANWLATGYMQIVPDPLDPFRDSDEHRDGEKPQALSGEAMTSAGRHRRHRQEPPGDPS